MNQGGMFWVYSFLGFDLLAKAIRTLSEKDYERSLGRMAILLSGGHVTIIRGLRLG